MLNYIFPKRLIKGEPIPKKGFQVHWKKTDYESLEIIHKGAIDSVQDTIKNHYEISRKYFSLLILVLSISSALCAFLFKTSVTVELKVIISVAILVCSLIILIIGQNIRPVRSMSAGRNPYKAITKKTFENTDIDQPDIKKLLIYQELLVCQAKIEMNQYYNNKRLEAMDFIIRLMIISFITLASLLFLVNSLT